MTAKPKLRAVPDKPLKHIDKPAPVRRYTIRPEWAHTNERHRAKYIAAIRYLRKGGVSKWQLDQPEPTRRK